MYISRTKRGTFKPVYRCGQRITGRENPNALRTLQTNPYSLLSREIIVLIIIANLIACPVASWYLMSQWLDGFAYRIDIKHRALCARRALSHCYRPSYGRHTNHQGGYPKSDEYVEV